MRQRILITGATGCIGKVLTKRMLDEGHQVSTFTRKPWRKWKIKNYVGDIGNLLSVQRALKGKEFDRIYHLATYGGYPGQEDWSIASSTNIIGTTNLLSVFGKHNCGLFINAGSSAEYLKDPQSTREKVYSGTKQIQSVIIKNLFGLMPAINAILYQVYGPGQASTRLISQLIKANLASQAFYLPMRGMPQALIYIDDVIDILAMSNLEKLQGKELKIHNGVWHPVEDVVRAIEAATTKKSKILYGDDQYVHKNYHLLTKATITGSTQLIDGMKKTVEWIKRYDM